MRIAVTGASGFLGSWVATYFSLNHKVLGLSRKESNGHRIIRNPNLTLVKAYRCDWHIHINKFDADIVIILDWDGVGGQFKNASSQHSNVAETMSWVSKLQSVKHIVGVGSQAELGNISGKIYENRFDNPKTEYAKAKIDLRKKLFNLKKNSELKITWARIFSTYGPLDNTHWFISSLIENLSHDRYFKMTRGEQIWSFLHVLDAAMAFETILTRPMNSQIVHIGNPQTQKLIDVANLIASKFDKNYLLEIGKIKYEPNQVMSLIPVCESLVAADWKPNFDINRGIDSLLEFKSKPNLSIKDFITRLI
jgi:UDP-glucose 4-epimerase